MQNVKCKMGNYFMFLLVLTIIDPIIFDISFAS